MGYLRNPNLIVDGPFAGEVHFRRWTSHPEMGSGVEITRADPTCLIDPRMFAEIAHGHHMPWLCLDAETGVLQISDDYGHRFVYKCEDWQVLDGLDHVKAKWPD